MERTSRASFRPQTWQSSLHVVLALLYLRAAPAVSAIDTLVVLHTNDFHGYISPDGDRAAGLARIATYFNRERARRSKVLALDAGDCVSGTPVSTLFQGRPIFTVMTPSRSAITSLTMVGARSSPTAISPTFFY